MICLIHHWIAKFNSSFNISPQLDWLAWEEIDRSADQLHVSDFQGIGTATVIFEAAFGGQELQLLLHRLKNGWLELLTIENILERFLYISYDLFSIYS